MKKKSLPVLTISDNTRNTSIRYVATNYIRWALQDLHVTALQVKVGQLKMHDLLKEIEELTTELNLLDSAGGEI